MTGLITEREAATLVERDEEIAAEEATLEQEIAQLRVREADAVEAAQREGKPSYGPSGKADGVRRKREAKERRLVTLREFERPASRKIAAEGAEALRAAKLTTARAQARTLDPIEAQNIERFARGFEECLRAYDGFASAASDRESIYEKLEQSGVLNGLDENQLFQLRKEFSSSLNPFPVSPAAAFEAITEAVLEPHAGNGAYRENFRQSHPTAAAFVDLTTDVREEGVYRRVHLRFTDKRSAFADYASQTHDRAGGAARR